MKRQCVMKKLFFAILLLGAFFGTTAIGYAAEPPRDKSEAYKKMVRDAGVEPEVSWDEETGIPTFIRGTLPVDDGSQNAITAASSEEKAYAFFNRYGGLFKMKDPATELSLLNSMETQAETHLRFQQMYQGNTSC